MMKRITALTLAFLFIATKALASVQYIGTDVNNGDTVDFIAYNTMTSSYNLVMRMMANPAPTVAFTSTSMLIDGVTFASILSAKEDVSAAFSGSYLDLTNKPSIPAAQVSSDWTVSSGVAQILNKPTIPTLTSQLTNNSGFLTSAPVSSVNGKTGAITLVPSDFSGFATVATSGAYTDIIGRPTLATVATTGSYSDLTGKPTLATVASTGAYSDLTGKPTIPSAQVNSDWAATSGVTQILNKPALMSTSAATHSVVTGTGATGFQVSSTRNSMVTYSLTIVTTATIAGNASGTLVLEEAPTNSVTSGDWVEVGRCTNGQSLSLAVALQSIQTSACPLAAILPNGYYAKIRSINNSGTPTYTFNSGQESLL